jgi:hypothetical protein
VELYTPPPAGGSVGTLEVVGPDHPTFNYPLQWVMPDGNMLQVIGRRTYRLTPGSWTWSTMKPLLVSNGTGSAGLMLPGGANGSTRVMVIGGLTGSTAVRTTQRYDYGNPAAGWSYGTKLPQPRSHMNVVQVPDGSAYGIGGNSSGLFDAGQRTTMAYNPASDTWTDMAVQSQRRAYHSTAILLPDGRIMSAGDNGPSGGRQLIDFYSPPYLFKGPRPAITSAPPQVGYGSPFNFSTSGPAVSRAVLMAPAATTHANEMNARHVELAITTTPTGFSATVASPRVAPPGYYMLFALTASGIPSQAKWVHVGP